MRQLLVTAFLGLVVWTALPAPAEARRVFGANLPDPLDPIGQDEGQFVVPRPFNRVLRDLRRTYGSVPGIVMRRVPTSPQVKAYNITNTRRGRTWDGINIYQDLSTKRVYLTVLRSQPIQRMR